MVHQPGAHRVGADVDDATVTSRHHVRQQRSYTVDGSPQVVVDGCGQRLLGVFEGGANQPAAGVVDQNVDMTESLDRHTYQVVGHARLVEFADEAAGDRRMRVHALQVFLA